jgi:hypothetical protein
MPHNATALFDRLSSACLRCAYFTTACVLASTTLFSFAQAQSNAAESRVLHAETLTLDWSYAPDIAARKQTAQAHGTTRSTSRALRFDAYGRRFNLALVDNDKWTQLSKSRGSTARAYRGELNGRSDSWVRLTQVGTATHGLIWDGEQLYAVAPANEVNQGTNGTVIFRLADTVTDNTEFCSAHALPDADSGAALYSTVQEDARKAVAEASLSDNVGDDVPVQLQLKLSVLIDAAFRAQYASDTAAIDAVIVRLNNVDGIFSSQFGTDVDAASIELAEHVAPLSDSSDAQTLLRSLAAQRAANPRFYGTGITHRFTGRDLSGTVVGLAYVDQVCDGSYGAALSESRSRGTWFDSLVIAHELGHSFGAPHDGDAACADTPKSFLMSPYINGSDRFSNCSSGVVQKRLEKSSCLAPARKADISVTPSLGNGTHTAEAAFAQTITVSNLGSTAAQHVEVEVTLPSTLTISEARFDGGYGGACTYGAGVVFCSAATLAANSNAIVSLSLRSTQLGTHDIHAAVTASSDTDLTNNAGSGTIVIETQTALPAVTPTASSPAANEPPVAAASGGGGGVNINGLMVLLLLTLARIGRQLRITR